MSRPSRLHRPAPVAVITVLAVLIGLAGGCRALGIRTSVSATEATDFLARAAGLVASGQPDRLCELSPADASTCHDSLEEFSPAVPTSPPEISCVVPAPSTGPLRGGQVVVVAGQDGDGLPYTSEFVVYDNGERVGVLDAVYWGGLRIVSYSEDTVTWRFDGESTTCSRGGLAVEDG